MAYINITPYDAKRIMQDRDRDYFTAYSLELILDYLDEGTEDDKGYRFDAVEVCCSFSQYDLNDENGLSSFINDFQHLVDSEEAEDILNFLDRDGAVLCSDWDNVLIDTDRV